MILKNPRVVGSVGIALNYQSTGAPEKKFAARRMTSKNSKTLQFSLIRTVKSRAPSPTSSLLLFGEDRKNK